MTTEEINNLAYTKQELPQEADLIDSALYYCLRGLYDKYESKAITAKAGKIMKQKYLDEYAERKMWEKIDRQTNKRMIEISQILDKAEQAGCEYVEEIKKVFYGLQG